MRLACDEWREAQPFEQREQFKGVGAKAPHRRCADADADAARRLRQRGRAGANVALTTYFRIHQLDFLPVFVPESGRRRKKMEQRRRRRGGLLSPSAAALLLPLLAMTIARAARVQELRPGVELRGELILFDVETKWCVCRFSVVVERAFERRG